MTTPSLRFALPILLLLASSPAFAEPPANKPSPPGDGKGPAPRTAYAAEILVLHATNSDAGIDPAIGPMPELSKPPFSAYRSYALLKKVRQPLEKGKPRTLTLPNDRVLRTELLDELPKEHVKISASINQPGGKTFLPLLEVKAQVGQAFIVAGQSYKGGILVLVVRVVT
jgi:hypothetical protein